MVYPRLLKDDFEKLPATLRRLHCAETGARARGIASVRHANSLLARLLRFPAVSDNIPVDLQIAVQHRGETWTRRFGGRTLRSMQCAERGLLVETIGPLCVRFQVTACPAGLILKSVDVRFWYLPLPIQIRATERAHDVGWEFEVEVSHVGSYRGVMELLP